MKLVIWDSRISIGILTSRRKLSGADWENIRNEEMKKNVGFLSFFDKC